MQDSTTQTAVETWRPIAGYEGSYEVSDLGRVKSLSRYIAFGMGRVRLQSTRILAGFSNNGYRRVELALDGSHASPLVHRLVAAAFLGPCPDGMNVCHNDGSRDNNTVHNLRYDTHFGNMLDRKLHGTEYKLNNTHCPHGHEFSTENVMIRPSGSLSGGVKRICRICHRESTRRSRHRAALARLAEAT